MTIKKYLKRSLACQPRDPATLTHTQLYKQRKNRQISRRNRKYVNDEIARRGCCEFCGLVDDPKVYQWHHIDDEDPTKKKVSDLIGKTTALVRLDRELNKCVLLCPNCHQKFHQDLLCMLDHKQQHIDGTFYDTVCKEEEPVVVVEEDPVQNSVLKFT